MDRLAHVLTCLAAKPVSSYVPGRQPSEALVLSHNDTLATNATRSALAAARPGYGAVRWDGSGRCQTWQDGRSCTAAGCAWTSLCPNCQGQCFPEGTGEGIFECSQTGAVEASRLAVTDTSSEILGEAFGCDVSHLCLPRPAIAATYQGHRACINGCSPIEAANARAWRAWYCTANRDDQFCRTRNMGSQLNTNPEIIRRSEPISGVGSQGVPIAFAQFVSAGKLVTCKQVQANTATTCQFCGGKVPYARGCSGCGNQNPLPHDVQGCRLDTEKVACAYRLEGGT